MNIIERFEKLLALLTSNPSFGTDTGQERRTDGGIRVFLGGRCSNSHRQLYGDINTKTGQRIDNAKDRWDKSQAAVQALQEKYATDPDGLLADPQSAMLAHWATVNEERFNCYKDILADDMRIYKAVVGEDWVAGATSQASAVRKIDPASLTQEQKDRIAACFKKNPVT